MTELQLRAKLKIPPSARRVILFGESSHWDTNWLQTSEEYFTSRIEPIFEQVLGALERDPHRVYCVESLFFFKLFWERHPAAQPRLRALLANRQLRMLASSFTTPDTLLPHHETILRDFQLGHAWLRDHGLPDDPGLAYFPDNFGHSPHLPSLMKAVGVRSVGLTRIDGMYFVGADYRPGAEFPRPGSTAALLEQELRTHDFIWRDDDGAEVLCHWNAFTYFHGDMLAHKGIIRWAGKVFALPWRTRRHIAARIDGYVEQLAPFARTPYLFCPIGMDFNDPIVELPQLLHRYNEEHFARTGTWTVLAGLDDYFSLLEFHRAQLPVLAADPNPYWMGFCATRPEVKQRPTRIARTLLMAEKLSAFQAPHAPLEAALREGWSRLVLSNHHDYIPGTSPDRVWEAEQRPWLDAAELAADQALALASPGVSATEPSGGSVQVRRSGDEIEVQTATYRFTLSLERGACFTSLVSDGAPLLNGLGFDLVAFHDEGGLWRLGHEYSGGRFAEVDRASRREAHVQISDVKGEVSFEISSELDGLPFVRTITVDPGHRFFRLRCDGVAGSRRTATCRFDVALDPKTLEMDTVGGVIDRPRERHNSPTFWAVPSRLTLRDKGQSLFALFESPTAASLSPTGALEWIVARNALKERAFGILPVMAHPIGGSNRDRQVHEAALMPSGLVDAPHLAHARRQLSRAWLAPELRGASHAAEAIVRCDAPGVTIAAVKRAESGEGVIVRLFCEQLPEKPIRVTVEGLVVTQASVCDALERELRVLEVEPLGQVVLPLEQRLTSLRLS
ncbi:MAG: putative alpha-mannosidase [Myxococcaceae bacterium]|nr:putative alpha-mannosidase [Myxococcaceae bacterium]